MILLLVFISLLYFTIIVFFIIGFNKIAITNNYKTKPHYTFSIIIPFRNEAKNLPILLSSLLKINYPPHLFEIILVNDGSEDDYQQIISTFCKLNPNLNLRVINSERQTGSPKKDAIKTAVKGSKHDWIVTTDADCEVPPNWLELFNQVIEEKEVLFISAPVKFREKNSLLFHFQNLNFISLIGSTIGSFGIHKPIMCNGANLCYNKEAFFKINGFDGNSDIPSGDDVFLLEKMNSSFPGKTYYLKSKEAIVKTNAEKNTISFYNQQVRWAGKSTAYNSIFSKIVGISVLLINATLIILLISSITNPVYWKTLITIFSLKLFIDFILIYKTSSFLNNTSSLKHFLITSTIYPFFVTYTGISSLFKSYQWKGRQFKK
jgi:cellulose synthase/poly-beta-1,6-N-acetylglucosamine synthase-like glycosyltransferase